MTLSTTSAAQAVPLIINGKDVATEKTFAVINPRTGQEVWKSYSATGADAVKAVESAQTAFHAWSKTKPAVRRDILLRAAELFQNREKELRQYQIDETGADPKFIDWILPLTVEQLKDVSGKVTSIQGAVPATSEEGRSAIVYKEPYGVVLGIAPWNAPWPLGCRAVSYALAAGNTVVLKGPELSPRCYWAIVDIFREAGLPDGCLNLVIHRSQDAVEVTNALIAHPSIKKINFTGSTAVGAIISSLAGKHLKPIITELGGKASAIILKDADIAKAAHNCALGAFLHAGQVCMSTERVIVHSSLIEPFTNAFKQCTDKIFPNSGVSPVLVSSTGAQKTRTLVSGALSNGAEVVFGNLTENSSSPTMRPIALRNLKKDSDLYYTESFGPTVVLFTFESEEEALAIANDTEYGLAGAVFTEDLATGLRVARQYETGAVHINAMSIHDDVSLPTGV
ncbi:hypothetical protein N7450_005482 [Penicillium hetheringtonii]|uniref:Aldehyde dehydrogenase domain-containing protein n=1 Tax=Penicillium hetheringtonii TaxID=911720 RepID=A0AAD6GR24_9EURO|nr:hypothetical protein N7450_005482 [Penicillium hetheringtonii]